MKSLFIKIFLWFWLATIMIMASTIVLLSLIEPHRPFREDSRQVRRLAREGQRAVDLLERQGRERLIEFFRARQMRQGRRLFLFDDSGRSLALQPEEPEMQELAVSALKSGKTEFHTLEKSILLARPFYGSGEQSYALVKEIPRRSRSSLVWRYLNPRFLSLRLLVIFIIASVFCYWLAWYLTLPVRKLRTATQHLASGDLKARVVPELGSRKDELADLGKDFDIMAERIESLMASQRRLLRDISHELRSPLTRLNVALELARRTSDKETQSSLDHIEQETERMNSLIGQLRTLTLLESGAGRIEATLLDLSGLVQGVYDDAVFEAKNRNISVQAELDKHIAVRGSQDLLRRAVENVVRNAIRYSPEGSAVEISLQRQDTAGTEIALIRVRDHGPGVPEESLERLFTPFYRVAESRDRQTGGMGIGLAITYHAVKIHGGAVRASNAPDGGLIVEIQLSIVP